MLQLLLLDEHMFRRLEVRFDPSGPDRGGGGWWWRLHTNRITIWPLITGSARSEAFRGGTLLHFDWLVLR